MNRYRTCTLAGSIVLATAVAVVGCKRTETDVPGKAGEAAPAKVADQAAPASTPAAAKPEPAQPFHHDQPAFTLQVPAGFVASEVTQTGPSNFTLRLAKPGEHSKPDSFISVTWFDGADFAGVLKTSQGHAKDAASTKDIAGGKGKLISYSKTTEKMVGYQKYANVTSQEREAVIEGDKRVFVCSVSNSVPDASPTLLEACATFSPN